jgi:hypothetical protein
MGSTMANFGVLALFAAGNVHPPAKKPFAETTTCVVKKIREVWGIFL